MNLPITIAGHRAEWRFKGSSAIDAWLDSRPWSERGDVRVLALPGERLADDVVRSVTRIMFAREADWNAIRIFELGREPATRGWTKAAAVAMSLDPEHVAAHDNLCGYLCATPTVFFAGPFDGSFAKRAADSGLEWIEQIGKSQYEAVATLILLSTPAAPVGGPVHFDLSVGEPVDPLMQYHVDEDVALWRPYVHRRLAWETAGNAASAYAVADAFAAIPFGDDDQVERLLNRNALAAYDCLSPSLRSAISEYLRGLTSSSRDALRGEDGPAAELNAAGLLWRPMSRTQPYLLPWLARAALFDTNDAGERGLFRSCLICAPLARELLGRCFELEALKRLACWSTQRNLTPSPDLEARASKFRERRSDSGIILYPAAYPAPPDDPWWFASFGEYASARQTDTAMRSLLDLRNWLAHGHYVSWAAVRKLREIERSIGVL